MIYFLCAECRATLAASETSIGKPTVCKTCGAFARVPESSTVVSPIPSAAHVASPVNRSTTPHQASAPPLIVNKPAIISFPTPSGRPPYFVSVSADDLVIPASCCSCGMRPAKNAYEPKRGKQKRRRAPRCPWDFQTCRKCHEWMEDEKENEDDTPIRSSEVDALEEKKKTYFILMIVLFLLTFIGGFIMLFLYMNIDKEIEDAKRRQRKRKGSDRDDTLDDAPPGALSLNPVEYLDGYSTIHEFNFWNWEYCYEFVELNRAKIKESPFS